MKFFDFINRIISYILIFSITLSLTACSGKEANAELTDPNPKIIVENIETENIETENIENQLKENFIKNIQKNEEIDGEKWEQ